MYNYPACRVKNQTNQTIRFILYVNEMHLCRELRTHKYLEVKYHTVAEDECFVRENGMVFREDKVFRYCVDKKQEINCLWNK